MRSRLLLICLLCLTARLDAAQCKGTLYMTFDTGSQSQAQLIADVLERQSVKATFFLANEKTIHGDMSLDSSWAPFWKRLVAQGHVFGSHTFDHVYLKGSTTNGKIAVRPQFGAHAGQTLAWTPAQYCAELKRVDARFTELTGQPLAHLWRAPGGRVDAVTLSAGTACGMEHVGWSPAGFLGDELSSQTHPNAQLLAQALHDLRDGDITMAHLGIWSRRDPWAPAVLEPLIVGLKERGFCFATLREHPKYRSLWK
jgi:peptidoglycan/xylan/chitin deacetylase (PgdA/CDA1 family)